MLNRRENALRVYHHEIPEYLPREKDLHNMVFPLDRYLGAETTGLDAWGVKWVRVPGMGSVVDHVQVPVMDDISEWRDQVTFPDLAALEATAIAPFAAAQVARWDKENQVGCCTICSGHFERLHHLMSFEDALCAFYDDPDSLHEFFDAMTEFKLECVRLTKKHFAPDVLIFHDDWGTNLNMFFSPELWREFIKPGLKRIVDETHALGMLFEMHSCGHIMPVMGDLVDDIGIDAIQHLQYPQNDVQAVKANWGDRLCIHGGFDSNLISREDTTEEQIRETTRKSLEMLAPGGGLIPEIPIVGANAVRNTAVFESEIDAYEASL